MMAGPPAATEAMAPTRHRAAPSRTALDDEYDEQQRRRRKRWMVALVTAICVGVFALVAWGASTMFGPQEPPAFGMPSVVKKAIGPATNELTMMHLRPKVVDVESSDDDLNKVLRTDPQAGTQVHAGQEVTVFKGIGVPLIQVPDLRGMTKDQAQATLERAGFRLDTPRMAETPDPSMVGKVLSQSETGSLKKGSLVGVTLGQPVQQVKVPDVRNLPVNTARQALEAANFKVATQDTDSDLPAGTVIASDPQAGSMVKPGSKVTLMVSNARQFTMPNLTGQDPDSAQQALRATGWNGRVQTQEVPTNDVSMDGKVVATKPSAGSKLNKDDSVVFYVGKYSSSPPTSTTGGGLFPFP